MAFIYMNSACAGGNCCGLHRMQRISIKQRSFVFYGPVTLLEAARRARRSRLRAPEGRTGAATLRKVFVDCYELSNNTPCPRKISQNVCVVSSTKLGRFW